MDCDPSAMPTRSTWLAILVLIAWLGAGAGCDRPILRDYYMGTSWLQPDKGRQEVARDEKGETIVEEEDAPAPE